MENNEVSAQANLIHESSLGDLRIGDDYIDWFADLGDPTIVADGDLYGTSYYDGQNSGVILTDAVNESYGYLFWQKDYDFTKNIYLRSTTYVGEGSGADGVTFYIGATNKETYAGAATGGIAVYADEYNDDTIKVYLNGVLEATDFYTYDTLDNQTYRFWEIVYEYVSSSENYIRVLMNNKLICRVSLGGSLPTGNYIGVSGWCGSQNNYHICRSFSVTSANPWLKIHG